MKSVLKKNSFPNAQGYTLENKISYSELEIFKIAINKQWLKRIERDFPEIAKEIKNKKLSIENYNEISDHLNHAEIWSKSERILPKCFSNWFINSSFAKDLEKKYGLFKISDEDNLGYPNIYWRLVRPRKSSDVGPLHRDAWFWELNNEFPKPTFNFSRLKVWIPIYIEKGFNGLLVEPFSQKRNDIKWSGEFRHGIVKPSLITPHSELNPILLNTNIGETVVFNDNLIHGGALNKGKKCRVSVEFTLLIKEE